MFRSTRLVIVRWGNYSGINFMVVTAKVVEMVVLSRIKGDLSGGTWRPRKVFEAERRGPGFFSFRGSGRRGRGVRATVAADRAGLRVPFETVERASLLRILCVEWMGMQSFRMLRYFVEGEGKLGRVQWGWCIRGFAWAGG